MGERAFRNVISDITEHPRGSGGEPALQALWLRRSQFTVYMEGMELPLNRGG